jgi:hypothetical protein
MPIEIKELLIKSTITSHNSDNTESTNTETSDSDNEEMDKKLNSLKKQILAECISNMSRLLKQSTER